MAMGQYCGVRKRVRGLYLVISLAMFLPPLLPLLGPLQILLRPEGRDLSTRCANLKLSYLRASLLISHTLGGISPFHLGITNLREPILELTGIETPVACSGIIRV
jgi:hypothetical protein